LLPKVYALVEKHQKRKVEKILQIVHWRKVKPCTSLPTIAMSDQLVFLPKRIQRRFDGLCYQSSVTSTPRKRTTFKDVANDHDTITLEVNDVLAKNSGDARVFMSIVGFEKKFNFCNSCGKRTHIFKN
jgi:hypothetical protein